MVQRIGGKRGRPAKTLEKGPWRPTPPDGKSLKDVAGTVEDLKWCCDLVRDEKLKSTVTVVAKRCRSGFVGSSAFAGNVYGKGYGGIPASWTGCTRHCTSLSTRR